MFKKGLAAIFAVAILLPIAAINAQESGKNYTGLAIRTPAEVNGFTYEFYLNPGDSVCDSYIARHDYQEETKPAILYTMASDLEINPETRQPAFPSNRLYLDNRFSLARWVTFESSEITLDRWGDEEDVNFCVTVPEDASAGSYYASVLLSTLTIDEFIGEEEVLQGQGTTGAGLGQRLGVNLIVTVSGEIDQKVNVENFEVLDNDKQGAFLNIFEYQPVNFRVTVDNPGNVFTTPAGDIFIHQGDLASPVASLVVNPSAIRVIPETRYSYDHEWKDGIFYVFRQSYTDENGGERNDGAYTLGVDPENLDTFRIGRYIAELQMTYRDVGGNRVRIPNIAIEFWIFPWKVFLIGAIITIGAVMAIRYSWKRR